MKHKFFDIEIKAVDDEGSFSGYAAVFNNVDLGGDVIAPGAFAKTIVEKSDHPVLWGHNMREVIGVNKSYVEDKHGLKVEGQLILDVQKAREARALMKAGAVTGMSIGYDTVKDELNHETGVRTLKELKLWEYSITPFPMNPEAQLTGVKSFEEFEDELRGLLAFLAERKAQLTPRQIALIEEARRQFSALEPPKSGTQAATQESIEPDSIHSVLSASDSLLSALKGI
jgi:HK97 family phage prohead protease